MEPVQIGMVGCGLFGESHLQAYRAVPLASVAAVYDVDQRRAVELAEKFGVPKVCGSLDELCRLPQVQAIDVVTGESAHRQPVVQALAAGKHIFVEKPLASKLEDCSAMIAAAAAADRYLMVGHVLRFETRYAMLKEAIDAGRLGRIASIHARRNRPKAQLARYPHAHPALENAVHDIDFILWCMNEPVRRARGYQRGALDSGHIDTFWGVLEFENGAIGVVQTIWLLPSESGITLDDSLQAVGTEGVAQLQLVPGGLSFWTSRGFDLPDVGYDPRVMDSARGALRDELAYFCECVRQGRAPTINTGVEAMRTMRVALALVESAKLDRDVVLSGWD
ncbi:MAG TPA: Gfo/Idh/MocA family oxidoreductase [Pirellulales bacterium]|nr:Gfo/Idh/MocA family oxidoreductase [Pirellulales bacterium]